MFTLLYALTLILIASCAVSILIIGRAEAASAAQGTTGLSNTVSSTLLLLVADPLDESANPKPHCKSGDKDSCLAAAQNGDADAQNTLGEMYFYGNGVQKDAAEAAKWLFEAANHGHPLAQATIGKLLANTAMGHSNYAEAMKWYRVAADKGDSVAQNAIGSLYDNGQGVPVDHVEAMKWYRLAADQGLAAAQFNVGSMCEDGVGVQQNYGIALEWYRLAADQDYAAAQAKIGKMNLLGHGTPKNYGFALKWYRLAANKGFAPANTSLGTMYENGQGVKQDYTEALKWYRLAADQGDAKAQYNLGVMYNLSRGVDYDYAKALKFYRLAAANGNAEAKAALDQASKPTFARQESREGHSEKYGQPILNTTASEIASAYDQNTVSADQIYKGKRFSVTGIVTSINTDFLGNPYVTLAGDVNRFMEPQFEFDVSSGPSLAQVRKGMFVTLICTGRGDVMKTPMSNRCSLISQ